MAVLFGKEDGAVYGKGELLYFVGWTIIQKGFLFEKYN